MVIINTFFLLKSGFESVKTRVKCDQIGVILEYRNKLCVECNYNLLANIFSKSTSYLHERFDFIGYDFMVQHCNPLILPPIETEMKIKNIIFKTRGTFKI